MLDGYSFLICGSGPITNSHLKVLKTFEKIKIKKIYSNNTKKVNNLSSDFNIEIVKNLELEDVKDCNVCLITNSSEKHLETIEKLSNYIKFFIVEKPLVENIKEFEKLTLLVKKKDLKIFEVSQFLFFDEIKKLNLVKKVEILVKKKRISEDYLNYKKIRTKDKSVIFRQLPHWYDVAKKITGEELKLDKTEFKILKDNISHLKLKLSGTHSEVTIKIDLNSEKNYPTQIFTDKKNITIEENILNKILKKLNFSNQLNLTETNLRNMYKSYLFEIDNKKYINCFDSKKYMIFDKLFKLTSK